MHQYLAVIAVSLACATAIVYAVPADAAASVQWEFPAATATNTR